MKFMLDRKYTEAPLRGTKPEDEKMAGKQNDKKKVSADGKTACLELKRGEGKVHSAGRRER